MNNLLSQLSREDLFSEKGYTYPNIRRYLFIFPHGITQLTTEDHFQVIPNATNEYINVPR